MLTLSPSAQAALRRHGEETYPEECCGILLGVFKSDLPEVEPNVATQAVPCTNVRSDSPRNRYAIDPKELIRIQRDARAQNLEIVGFYHSHPDHAALWSSTDLAEAHWIGFSYVITSVVRGQAKETRSFRLTGSEEGSEEHKRFVEEELLVSEPQT